MVLQRREAIFSYCPVVGHVQAASMRLKGRKDDAKSSATRATGVSAGIGAAILAAPAATACGTAACVAVLGEGAVAAVGGATLGGAAMGAGGHLVGHAVQSGGEVAAQMKHQDREACNKSGRTVLKETAISAALGGVFAGGANGFEVYQNGGVVAEQVVEECAVESVVEEIRGFAQEEAAKQSGSTGVKDKVRKIGKKGCQVSSNVMKRVVR